MMMNGGEFDDDDDEDDEGLASTVVTGKTYPCPTCGIRFAKAYNRDRHFNRVHNVIQRAYECTLCGAAFDSVAKLRDHRDTHAPSTGYEEVRQAFGGKCIIYRKTYPKKMYTFEQALNADGPDILRLLEHQLETRKSMKVGLVYQVEFIKLSPDEVEEEAAAVAAAAVTADAAADDSDNDFDDSGISSFPQLDGAESVDEEEEAGPSRPQPRGQPQPLQVQQPQQQQQVAGPEVVSDEDDGGDDEMRLGETFIVVWMRPPCFEVNAGTHLTSAVHLAGRDIQARIDDYVARGSGWRLNQILCSFCLFALSFASRG